MWVPRSKEAGPHALPDTVGAHVGTIACSSAMTCALLRWALGSSLGAPGPEPAPPQPQTTREGSRASDTPSIARCPPAAHMPPGWHTPSPETSWGGSRMALRGSGRSGGRGRREQGSSLEATAGTACVAGSHGLSLCRGAAARSPGREKGGRRGRLRARPSWRLLRECCCSPGHFLVSAGREMPVEGTYLGARPAGLVPGVGSSPSPGFADFSRFICCRIEFNSLITFAFGPERIGL